MAVPVRTDTLPTVTMNERVRYEVENPYEFIYNNRRRAWSEPATYTPLIPAPIVEDEGEAEKLFLEYNPTQCSQHHFMMHGTMMLLQQDMAVINGGPAGIYFASLLCFYLTQAGDRLVGLQWLLPKPEYKRNISRHASGLKPYYFVKGNLAGSP